MRKTIGILVVALVLAACSDQAMSPEASTEQGGTLTQAQLDEMEALEAEARAALENPKPFVPTADWEEIHENVWQQVSLDQDGEVVGERLHLRGLEAMTWVAQNIWEPGIQQMTNELSGEISIDRRATLEAKRDAYLLRLSRYEYHVARESEGLLAPMQGCVALANASASSTSQSICERALLYF